MTFSAMKSNYSSVHFLRLKILVSLLLFFQFAVNVKGDDEISLTECKSVMTKLIKGQLTKVKDCLSEMDFNGGKEKSEKMLCVIVCAMKKSGFLDAESRPDAASSLSFLEAELPPTLRNRVMDAFVDCHEHLGVIVAPADDPYCRSYEPLMKCAQNTMNKICV